MAGFTVYSRMPEDDLRKAATTAIEQINEWFSNNPDRKDCTVELWYGRVHTFERDSVAEEVNQLAEKAIAEDNAARARQNEHDA